jgi:hypothetical protein
MITYNDKTQKIRRKMEKENKAEWESVAVALRKVHGHILEAHRVQGDR